MAPAPAATAQGSPTFPPGPPGAFGFGHALLFASDALSFLTDAAAYGDVVGLRFAARPSVLLNRADLVAQYFADTETFAKRLGGQQAAQLSRNLVGNGIIAVEGEEWKRARRLMMPAFDHARVLGYCDTFTDYTQRRMATWRAGATVDVREEAMQLTSAIALKALFGADVDSDEAHALGDDISTCFAAANDTTRRVLFFLPRSLPTPLELRFDAAYARLSGYLTRLAQRRRASGEDAGDLLSTMLRATYEDGSRISDAQLRDEMVTLFTAGHETTALAITWALALLAAHPAADAAVQAELTEVLGGRPATGADYPRLVYLQGVVNEALRLYPPAFLIARVLSADTVVDGFTLPRGTFAIASPWTLGRDARHFAEPTAFRPERWTERDLKRELPPGVYFPFGGGKRVCIGAAFAMMEAVLCLATILQRFRLELASGAFPTPQPMVTLRPADGTATMRLVARR